MNMLDQLPAAIAEVQRRLDTITADQLSLPSVCEGWDVQELCRHLVAGAKMAPMLFGGATRDDVMALFADYQLSADPAAEFAAAAAEELHAFRSAADLGVVLPHPAMPMPAEQVLQFRITDYVVHAWDLAHSVGGDDTLSPELVGTIWEAIQPMVPMIPHVGVFGSGPSGAITDEAPLQTRLLDMLGRRP